MILTLIYYVIIMERVDKEHVLIDASNQVAFIVFRSSSVVELSAVNRSVVGSSPTCGAIRGSTQEAEEAPLLRV
jgi:hypothetical protein